MLLDDGAVGVFVWKWRKYVANVCNEGIVAKHFQFLGWDIFRFSLEFQDKRFYILMTLICAFFSDC